MKETDCGATYDDGGGRGLRGYGYDRDDYEP